MQFLKKTVWKIRENRDSKLVTTKARRNFLISEKKKNQKTY